MEQTNGEDTSVTRTVEDIISNEEPNNLEGLATQKRLSKIEENVLKLFKKVDDLTEVIYRIDKTQNKTL